VSVDAAFVFAGVMAAAVGTHARRGLGSVAYSAHPTASATMSGACKANQVCRRRRRCACAIVSILHINVWARTVLPAADRTHALGWTGTRLVCRAVLHALQVVAVS
jgi:hypothetical protein